MGLFSWLFQSPPNITIDHPRFGRMTFYHSRWAMLTGSSWCEYYFEPIKTKITLSFSTDRRGPTPLQEDAEKTLEDRYNALTPDIAARIRTIPVDEGEENFTFDDFSQDFLLTGIHIAVTKHESVTCELTFESALAKGYYFVAVYEDWDLKEVSVAE